MAKKGIGFPFPTAHENFLFRQAPVVRLVDPNLEPYGSAMMISPHLFITSVNIFGVDSKNDIEVMIGKCLHQSFVQFFYDSDPVSFQPNLYYICVPHEFLLVRERYVICGVYNRLKMLPELRGNQEETNRQVWFNSDIWGPTVNFSSLQCLKQGFSREIKAVLQSQSGSPMIHAISHPQNSHGRKTQVNISILRDSVRFDREGQISSIQFAHDSDVSLGSTICGASWFAIGIYAQSGDRAECPILFFDDVVEDVLSMLKQEMLRYDKMRTTATNRLWCLLLIQALLFREQTKLESYMRAEQLEKIYQRLLRSAFPGQKLSAQEITDKLGRKNAQFVHYFDLSSNPCVIDSKLSLKATESLFCLRSDFFVVDSFYLEDEIVIISVIWKNHQERLYEARTQFSEQLECDLFHLSLRSCGHMEESAIEATACVGSVAPPDPARSKQGSGDGDQSRDQRV